MGHPAEDSGIYVDNAQCFKIFEILQKWGYFEQFSVFCQ